MVDKAFDAELVRQKMKEQRISQAALARAMGLNQSAISNMLAGDRSVKADEARFIYDLLGIKSDPGFRFVPVIGIASAGRWREAVELPIGQMPIPPKIEGRTVGPKAFGLEVRGDSMDRIVKDGGWVLIDPDQKELRPGSCYLIANNEHDATVKLYQRGPARFEPCSTNPEHQAFAVAETDFTVIGRVIWQGGPLP